MKAILDKYLSRHYEDVRKYTNYFLVRMKSRISADVVINNSYIYLVGLKTDINTEDKMKSYLFNTIKKQIIWNTSQSNKDEHITAFENTNVQEAEDNTDLQDKIELERKYQLHKSCIEVYRNNIDDRIKLLIFEAYYDKGYSTARAMGKYFNLPFTTAHFWIREIKNDLLIIKKQHEN